jgi:hypothetical protein
VNLTVGQESSVKQSRADISPLKSAEPLPSDPLDDVLIRPEMIMTHALELKLTAIQLAFIHKEVENSNVKFNELSWQLDEAVEVLRQMILVQAVNEERALAQLDRVLDTERKIKRLHIRMSIRIRNQLTPEQLVKLQSIRRLTGRFVEPTGICTSAHPWNLSKAKQRYELREARVAFLWPR